MSKPVAKNSADKMVKSTGMVFFITFLRALAACLITNAHYTSIYPTDFIANGGLIGDVLFFAVSGYCLYNVKYELSAKGFLRWYGKRIWRCYLPVVIMTGIYMLIGLYSLSEHNALWWYIYPTYYHFIASIIVLYIPFFFIMKIEMLKKNVPKIMSGLAVVWLIVYIVFYDKSHYHIDTVREPMIRFLFMESMLLGAWFRQNDQKLRNDFKTIYPIISAVAFVFYFASKLLFSRRQSLSSFQFINQIMIFVLLFFLFRTFCGLDHKLENMPKRVKSVVEWLSKLTLEIYVVQYVLIDVIRQQGLMFPINWICITLSILVSAFILHFVCDKIYKSVDKLLTSKEKK